MGAAVHAREARETREMRETRVRACQHELTRRNFRTVHALSLRYVIACRGEGGRHRSACLSPLFLLIFTTAGHSTQFASAEMPARSTVSTSRHGRAG